MLIIVALLIFGGVIGVAWRYRSAGSKAVGIVLEAVAWLFIVVLVVAQVVSPLLRLVNRTYNESRAEEKLTWQVDDLPVTLNEAGVDAVYGKGVTQQAEVNGWADVHGAYLTEPQTAALVKLQHPSPVDFMATTGSTIIGGLIVVAGVVFLLRVLRTVRRGTPFDPANVKWLYSAGICFLGAGAFVWVSAFFTFFSLDRLSDHVFWAVEIPLTPLILGLVVIVVAEVFRQGLKLSRDTEGLV
ncbi:MAG: DUF2975 domain-containing protein [Micrococcales bacterium]|nr:DUF2975 domain-containing protein [Micrococcales bacterium]MCL2666869.1 DUF2975 domain-containing protein [Micrococcales bacterium]